MKQVPGWVNVGQKGGSNMFKVPIEVTRQMMEEAHQEALKPKWAKKSDEPTCKWCGKKFPTKAQRNNHIKKEHPEKWRRRR